LIIYRILKKLEKDTDISSYQRAILKEDIKRRISILQNKESISQGAFSNYQHSLKNMDHSCAPAELTLIQGIKKFNNNAMFATAAEVRKQRKKQSQFLAIKGEKKDILTDSALANFGESSFIIFS